MRKRHIAFLCKLYLYYLINGTIKKKILNMKLCSDFIFNVCLKHSMTKWARYDQKCILVHM